MLRALIVVLCVVNLAFYAWSHGWLGSAFGAPTPSQRDPARLEQQINAQNMVLHVPASASAASKPASNARPDISAVASSAANSPSALPTLAASAAPAATPDASGAALASVVAGGCLQIGSLDGDARQSLVDDLHQSLPQLAWSETNSESAGLWMIYMGRYASQDMLEKKEDELRRIHMNFDEVLAPADLAFGLSLGRFNDLDQGKTALSRMHTQGIRTARLVMLRAPKTAYTMRFTGVDDAQRKILQQVLPDGHRLTACPGT